MYIFKQESECFIRNPYTEKWAEITEEKPSFQDWLWDVWMSDKTLIKVLD